MTIDFHTHIFPDKIAMRAVSALEKSGNIKAAGVPTVEGLEKRMSLDGIDYSVILPIATKPQQCPSINRFAFEMNKRDKIISFGSVHPMYENWENELIEIKNAGLKGIKLHPDFQGYYIDDEIVFPVLEKACELGLAVVVHCGKDISFEKVHCTPKRLVNAAKQFKGLKLIVAHLGGLGYLDEAEEFLVGKDYYLDVSFVLNRSDKKQICRMLRNHNPNMLFLGSDFPWDLPGRTIEKLQNLDISEELKDKILHKNASDFLCITEKIQKQSDN